MKKSTRNTLAASLFLVSRAAFGKDSGTPTTAPAVVGVDRLMLSETPGSNATVCYAGTGKSGTYVPDSMTVTLGSSTTSPIILNFAVNDILPDSGSEPMILFVLYGTSKASTPQLNSKNQTYPFLLGQGLQVLTSYRVTPFTAVDQTVVSIGKASNKPKATFTFQVELDRAKVQSLISISNGMLYFQAGLLPEVDLATSKFSRAIFSEVDTVTFAANCSSSATTTVSANSSGSKTSTTNTTSSGKTSTSSGVSSTTSGKSSSGTASTKTGGK